MRRFLERGCTGRHWRQRFPNSSKSEIRDFLDVFVEAFGFRQNWRLCFAPEDRAMDVYRAVNPLDGAPDDMELEILVEDLEKRYQVNVLSSWREEITLADLFARTRKSSP